MHTKLTLRLDDGLVRRAKSSARKRGKSVSQIVADFFVLLDEKPKKRELQLTPLVRSLKGALRGTAIDEKDYRQHLEKKYL